MLSRTHVTAALLLPFNRWCVTGTPIGKGSIDDLYGLLVFLQVQALQRILYTIKSTFDTFLPCLYAIQVVSRGHLACFSPGLGMRVDSSF